MLRGPPPLLFWLSVFWFAVLGIEIPAKNKNAGQSQNKENEAKSQPDIPPKDGQIEHRREHGGNEEE